MSVCDPSVTLRFVWQMWMSVALSWLAAHPTLTVSTPTARTNAEVWTGMSKRFIFYFCQNAVYLTPFGGYRESIM